jgi:C1A family cysteine protease
MSYIDEFGYARFTGTNYGGHAYLIRGGNRLARDPVTRTLGKGKLRNSWGDVYGEGGEAWITYKDIQALIDDYGEMALPIELKVKL